MIANILRFIGSSIVTTAVGLGVPLALYLILTKVNNWWFHHRRHRKYKK